MIYTFTAKCISCGKKWDLTPAQESEAFRDGCVISPCCLFPSTVERAEAKIPKVRITKRIK